MVHKSLWKVIFLFILYVGVYETLAIDFKTYNSTFSLQVEKESGGTFVCSSVAINAKTLLTAAHCLEDARKILVTDGKIKRRVMSWSVHPQYNKEESKYFADIGIINLIKVLPESINYPQLKRPLPYHSLNRIGFGGREGKNVRTLVSGIWITDVENTTLILKDELGVPGDSGGPLFQFVNNELYLVAIHSTVEGKKSYAPIVEKLISEEVY